MENVLLMFGGMSYEHDISIVTASQVFNKTRLENYQLVPIYISKNNRFYVYKSEKFELGDFVDFEKKSNSKKFKEIAFVSGENGKLFLKSLFGLKELLSANYAIIACHGGDGENGRLEAFLEKFGIFSSAGSIEGLEICMNKALFKTIMRGQKLKVVSGFVVNETLYRENYQIYEPRFKFMKFPVVLKPVKGGSSIGLFVAKSKEEFNEMIMSAFEFDEDILVEKFISGAREFNVAVVGDKDSYEVSEVDEPLKLSEILSFEDKYLSGEKNVKGEKSNNSMISQKKNFPAKISDELRDRLRGVAKDVFVALNLSGVVRIDFLYDENTGKIYICEVNAVPGSLSYYFFEQGKVLINDFVLKLINIAKKKSDENNKIKIDYATKILS